MLAQSHPQLFMPSGWECYGGLIWISCHDGVSGECIVIVPGLELSDHAFSICCFICHVTLPLSSQWHFLTIKASVTTKRSSKLPDFSRQPWAFYSPHVKFTTGHSPLRSPKMQLISVKSLLLLFCCVLSTLIRHTVWQWRYWLIWLSDSTSLIVQASLISHWSWMRLDFSSQVLS